MSSTYAQQSWNEDVDQFLDDPQVIEDYKNLEGLEQNNYNFRDYNHTDSRKPCKHSKRGFRKPSKFIFFARIFQNAV